MKLILSQHSLHMIILFFSTGTINNFDLRSSNYNYDPYQQAFLTYFDPIYEPLNFYEVVKDPKLIETVDRKLKTLEDNNTWTFMSLSAGKKVIGNKWIFKIKYLLNDS